MTSGGDGAWSHVQFVAKGRGLAVSVVRGRGLAVSVARGRGLPRRYRCQGNRVPRNAWGRAPGAFLALPLVPLPEPEPEPAGGGGLPGTGRSSHGGRLGGGAGHGVLVGAVPRPRPPPAPPGYRRRGRGAARGHGGRAAPPPDGSSGPPGPPRTLTLFVAEQRPEAVARQLLFLLLATEGCTGHRARAVALLELLGSSRLRSATAELLTGAAGRLRRWLTAGTGPVPAEVELMKSRERDAVEAVLRGWGQRGQPRGDRDRDREPPAWERRLRRLHGARYDAREALADWDLRMGLHQRGATTVSPAEFGRWRESGVAFVPRGGGRHPQPHPAERPLGPARAELGYWGDVVAGPFLAFGLTSDDPRLLRTRNGAPEKTATEISVANVTALLRELLAGGG
ncbi:dynein axonemal assembly factor 3-like [Anser cygnoides]|uniref:dynein axonemal assembly factor 3-like n=1 Tax=Anser cygnoides TaxID=8845 RepID=UPI0034D1A50E